ncbi:putative uncharacterized protein DDB_G0282133, partial [Sitophilus oryzae]|uniref:Uncharacterized protein n=1 Tax=Sitophilus oryzae TaxID=7048 RepID=A0A6J2Y2D8_SITOR
MSQQHRLKVKPCRRSSGRSTPNLLNSQTTEYQSNKFKKRKREEDDEEQLSNKKSCLNPNSQKVEVSNSSNVLNTNNNGAQNRLSTLRQKIKGDLEQNKVSYSSNRTFCRKNSETKYLSQSSVKNRTECVNNKFASQSNFERVDERNIVSAPEDRLNTKSVSQSAVNNRLKRLNSSNCPRVPEVNVVSDLRHKLKGDTLSLVNRGTNANQNQKAESSSHSSVNNRLKCIKTKSTNSSREPKENILISVKESNRQISLIEFATSNNNDSIKLGNEIKEKTEFSDITCEDDSKSTPAEEICLPNEKTSVTEWLNGNKCEKDLDVTVNDSLLVNFDDTIVNKREQTCNTIAEDSMEWDSATEESPEKTKKENAICIVTDTNVFMHFLHKIKDIVNFKVT